MFFHYSGYHQNLPRGDRPEHQICIKDSTHTTHTPTHQHTHSHTHTQKHTHIHTHNATNKQPHKQAHKQPHTPNEAHKVIPRETSSTPKVYTTRPLRSYDMGSRSRDRANLSHRRRGLWKCMIVGHSIQAQAVARDRDRDLGGLSSATTTATATTTANM